mgnify:CR=1 FL=1
MSGGWDFSRIYNEWKRAVISSSTLDAGVVMMNTYIYYMYLLSSTVMISNYSDLHVLVNKNLLSQLLL